MRAFPTRFAKRRTVLALALAAATAAAVAAAGPAPADAQSPATTKAPGVTEMPDARVPDDIEAPPATKAPPVTKASAATRAPSLRKVRSLADATGVPRSLIAQAVTGGDGATAAIRELRRAGAAAVAALRAAAPPEHDPTFASWKRALDAVCAQRDCAASGLYWHTDLGRAIAAAEASGRPILSVRLLGRLDEELSCANSRFFRTVLYADPEVSARLREGFVLHWETVRPAPRLTIDFGDGRRLEGTITGNSVHYVLDSRGRLIDALPGLYGPGLFLDRLADAGATASRLGAADGDDFLGALRGYHRERLAALDGDLAGMGGLDAVAPQLALSRAAPDAGPVAGRPDATAPEGGDPEAPEAALPADAREAGVMAIAKSRVELPVVQALWLTSWRPVLAGEETEGAEPFDWGGLAAARRSDWRLSDASRAVILAKHRPDDLFRGEWVIDDFEELVGLDTVRNEYLLHAVVHRWLVDDPRIELERFTRRLYAQLFLTPDDDPWLGLVSPDTYLALDRPLVEPGQGSPATVELEPEAIRSSAAAMRRAEGVER